MALASRGSRKRRTFVLSVVGALTAAAASLGVVGMPSVGAVEASTPVEELGACIAGGGSAEILLLVDTSSSLVTADPENARVTAADYFVGQLAETASSSGASVEVQLSIFAHGFETVAPWTELTTSSVEVVRSQIATLADRVDGFDTDYWTALDGARTALADKRGGDPAAEHCQSIVIFSDGKLDISPRLTAEERTAYGVGKTFAPGVEATSPEAAQQLVAAAQQDICRDGGLADQLTTSGVTLFGIGLSPAGAEAVDFDVLESLTVGTSGKGTLCGALVEPARGQFFLASDIDELLFAFDSISTPGNPPITQTTGICQVAFCEDRSHRFVLDGSTPEVRILASADLAGLEAAIKTPSGDLVELASGAAGTATKIDSSGVVGSFTWESGKTIAINISPSAAAEGAWPGLWQFAFVDPSGQSESAESRSNLHISGSLAPTVLGGDELELHTGEVLTGLSFGIVGRDGEAFDSTRILGKMTYEAIFEDSAGTSTTLISTEDPSSLAAPVDLDLSEAAIGDAKLVLRLGITTADVRGADGTVHSGTVLEPTVVSLPLNVAPPLEFPQIGSEVRFGTATGTADVTGQLDASGTGCVWIASDAEPTVATAPEGIGALKIVADGAQSSDTCFPTDGGEGLTLKLTTEAGGNGSLHGTVPVTLQTADGQGDPIIVDVPFSAEMQKPLNTTNFILVAIAAPLLGLGIPILLLYLAKYLVAKVPSRPLVAATVPIRVESGHVLREGVRFALEPRDLTGTVAIPARGARAITVGGLALKSRSGLAPTSAGYVVVEAPGLSTASGAYPSTIKGGLRARLPLAVHNNWIVAHAPGAPASEAQVTVLVGGAASPAERASLEDDINRRLPDVLARLIATEEAAGSAPRHEGELVGSSGGGDPLGPSNGLGLGGGGSNQGPAAGDAYDVFGGGLGGRSS